MDAEVRGARPVISQGTVLIPTVVRRGPLHESSACATTSGHSRLARDLRPFDQRLELRPRDLRVRAPAEAAVGAGDQVFAAHSLREPEDALRHELGCSTTAVECVTQPGPR